MNLRQSLHVTLRGLLDSPEFEPLDHQTLLHRPCGPSSHPVRQENPAPVLLAALKAMPRAAREELAAELVKGA